MRALLSFRIAYAHIRSSLGRLALSVIALMLGVALVVAMQVMNVSVLEAFLDAMEGLAGRAALSITAEGMAFRSTRRSRALAGDGVSRSFRSSTPSPFPTMAAASC